MNIKKPDIKTLGIISVGPQIVGDKISGIA